MACFEGLFRVAFRLTKGLEHLPREAPSILDANHLSFIDPFIIHAAVPRTTISQLFTLGWEPYFCTPFHRCVARVGHVIPVGPDMHLIFIMQISAALLRSGKPS
jgi:long-chain acyl-CoA synthetase